jgi:hypothetical protein
VLADANAISPPQQVCVHSQLWSVAIAFTAAIFVIALLHYKIGSA